MSEPDETTARESFGSAHGDPEASRLAKINDLRAFSSSLGLEGELFITPYISSVLFNGGPTPTEAHFPGWHYSIALTTYILARFLHRDDHDRDPIYAEFLQNIDAAAATSQRRIKVDRYPSQDFVEELIEDCLEDLDKLAAFIERFGPDGHGALRDCLDNIRQGKNEAAILNGHFKDYHSLLPLVLYFARRAENPHRSYDADYAVFVEDFTRLTKHAGNDTPTVPSLEILRDITEPKLALLEDRLKRQGLDPEDLEAC